MERRMLKKEDEAATGTGTDDEVEVRREDQDRINKFSRLHQRELAYEEELRGKAKEKEALTDVAGELELVLEDSDEDDDDLDSNDDGAARQTHTGPRIPYRIGDTFVMLPLSDVRARLEAETTSIEEAVAALEAKLGATRDEMVGLKEELYRRFGRSINLES